MPDEAEAVQQVIGSLTKAFNAGTRGLVVVRCANEATIERACNVLGETQTPFGWQQLPMAHLPTLDLLGHVIDSGSAAGPAFLAYGLPKGPDGRLDATFAAALVERTQQYLRQPTLLVLACTVLEMRMIGAASRELWASRGALIAWPTAGDADRFVPAKATGGLGHTARGGVAHVQRGGVATRADGGVAQVAAGGVAQTAAGGVAQTAAGGVAQTAAGGVAQAAAGGVAAQGAGGIAGQAAGGVADQVASGVSAAAAGQLGGTFAGPAGPEQDPDSSPWSGSPFGFDDEVPPYYATAPPPAGRRWGQDLIPDDDEAAAELDDARRLLDALQIEEAWAKLAKLAKSFRDEQGASATAECYVLLGKAAEASLDHQVAFDWYRAAMNLYDQIDDAAGYSDCAAYIGYLYFLHGNLPQATRCFQRAIERDEDADDDLRLSTGLRRLGIVAEQTQELSDAARYFEKASKLEKANNDDRALSRSLNHLARIRRLEEKLDEAAELLEQSLDIKEELEDDAGLASGFHELGNLRLNGGHLEEALEAYQKALEIELRYRDIPGIAVTQAQIGLVRTRLGDHWDAVRALSIARELFERLNSPHAAVIEKALEGPRGHVSPFQLRDLDAELRAEIDELLALPDMGEP